MWNLKYDTGELIHKAETDSQTQKTDIVTKGEGFELVFSHLAPEDQDKCADVLKSNKNKSTK